MNSARTMVYRFFDLPHIVRIDIIKSLGFYRDEDKNLQDTELFNKIIKQIINNNALAAFWDAIEQKHADSKHPLNPFAQKKNV